MRKFMRPDEIAAEISGERDIHVECVLETLEGLRAMGLDPCRLLRFATGGIIPSPPAATADHPPAWLSCHPPAWPVSPPTPLDSALVRDLASGKLLRYDGGQWAEVPLEEWPGAGVEKHEP